MIIGGPFAFLAGLFSLGAAGVGELARDAKIKAGTPELNEYGRCKRNNIANFDEGYLRDQVKGPFRNIYLGGLDWDKIAKDFAEKHGFEYSSSWMYDWAWSQRLKELYYDRILNLVGIQTNTIYKASDHQEYFMDPKWRAADYEYLKQIPRDKLPKFTDVELGFTWGECQRQEKVWRGIRSVESDLKGLKEGYAGKYSPLKIPTVNKIHFLEDVEQEEDEIPIVE